MIEPRDALVRLRVPMRRMEPMRTDWQDCETADFIRPSGRIRLNLEAVDRQTGRDGIATYEDALSRSERRQSHLFDLHSALLVVRLFADVVHRIER